MNKKKQKVEPWGKTLSLSTILTQVGYLTRIPPSRIITAEKTAEIVAARNLVAYFAHDCHDYSYPEIAAFFRRSSHSMFVRATGRAKKAIQRLDGWENVEEFIRSLTEDQRCLLLQKLNERTVFASRPSPQSSSNDA